VIISQHCINCSVGGMWSIFVHEVGGLWKEAHLSVFVYHYSIYPDRPRRRASSWDNQYVAEIHTRHASHTNKRCENPFSMGHSESSWRVCMENGENGKYEKMRGQYTTQRWTINLLLNKVTILFPKWDLPLYSGCHKWQKFEWNSRQYAYLSANMV
jgi:hypothetical protein